MNGVVDYANAGFVTHQEGENPMTSEAAKPASIAWSPYVDRLLAEHKELIEASREALLQLEYLHEKFTPTSTGEAVISRLNALLKRLESA